MGQFSACLWNVGGTGLWDLPLMTSLEKGPFSWLKIKPQTLLASCDIHVLYIAKLQEKQAFSCRKLKCFCFYIWKWKAHIALMIDKWLKSRFTIQWGARMKRALKNEKMSVNLNTCRAAMSCLVNCANILGASNISSTHLAQFIGANNKRSQG